MRKTCGVCRTPHKTLGDFNKMSVTYSQVRRSLDKRKRRLGKIRRAIIEIENGLLRSRAAVMGENDKAFRSLYYLERLAKKAE